MNRNNNATPGSAGRGIRRSFAASSDYLEKLKPGAEALSPTAWKVM